jgi:hypothetical protein
MSYLDKVLPPLPEGSDPETELQKYDLVKRYDLSDDRLEIQFTYDLLFEKIGPTSILKMPTILNLEIFKSVTEIMHSKFQQSHCIVDLQGLTIKGQGGEKIKELQDILEWEPTFDSFSNFSILNVGQLSNPFTVKISEKLASIFRKDPRPFYKDNHDSNTALYLILNSTGCEPSDIDIIFDSLKIKKFYKEK